MPFWNPCALGLRRARVTSAEGSWGTVWVQVQGPKTMRPQLAWKDLEDSQAWVSKLPAMHLEPPGRPPQRPWSHKLEPYLSVCMLHIYIYEYAYIYIYTDIYMILDSGTYVRACMHACMHACIQVIMHAGRYACIHTYMYTYIHTYIHTYMYTYIHTYIHIYIIHTCMYSHPGFSKHSGHFSKP